MHVRSNRCGAIALTLLVGTALLLPCTAHAITRADVIKRANVWVKKKVPYSQTKYATVAGSLLAASTVDAKTKGYRTDCSGFVSMSLDLKTAAKKPVSLDTGSLPVRLSKISKAQLLPGDVILRPKTLKIKGKLVPYGHAVVFGGWTDSKKTAYWGLHQSGSAKGTVRAKISWGKSGFGTAEGFAPYRYPGVRDGIVVPRTFGR